MNTWLIAVPLALSLIIFVPAVVSDLLHRRIPNTLCLTGFLAGITFHGLTAGLAGLSLAVLAGLTLMGAMFSFYMIGWLGAGDIKLLAAAGAIGGTPAIAIDILMAVVSLGAIAAFASLIWREGLLSLSTRLASSAMLTRMSKSFFFPLPAVRKEATGIPYALAIAAGTFLVLALNSAGVDRGTLFL